MTTPSRWKTLLAAIEAARTPAGRNRLQAFSLEGTRLVERALRQGIGLHGMLVRPGWVQAGGERAAALEAELERAGVERVELPVEEFDRATGGRDLGGLLALAPLPAPADLADLVATDPRALVLVCAGVEDPGNVGALVRTAHASGARAVVFVQGSDPLHPRAVRTSMGSLFALPVAGFPDFESALAELRSHGFETLGSVCRGGTPLDGLSPAAGPRALFLGSEAFGLGDAELRRLDRAVHIPMPAGVDSFSVNAAAAVLLYGLGRASGPGPDR